MADQFENQLPQKSDAKWVRALDASGNPILISKEDLASVVGGLLGLEFVKREDINDANRFFTGYARIYTSTNCPDNLPGIIISFNINGVVVQFFFSGWPRRLYARMYWDAWNSWIKITDL